MIQGFYDVSNPQTWSARLSSLVRLYVRSKKTETIRLEEIRDLVRFDSACRR